MRCERSPGKRSRERGHRIIVEQPSNIIRTAVKDSQSMGCDIRRLFPNRPGISGASVILSTTGQQPSRRQLLVLFREIDTPTRDSRAPRINKDHGKRPKDRNNEGRVFLRQEQQFAASPAVFLLGRNSRVRNCFRAMKIAAAQLSGFASIRLGRGGDYS